MPARRQHHSRQRLQLEKPSIISLFTCGMGMDIGFEKAGFSTKYANDITKFACNTIRENKPGIHCDEGDITEISSAEILERASLRRGSVDVVIGGPPCQSFSTAGKRRGLKDKRGFALLQYLRVINDVKPKFFVFENVPGLLSVAKNHVSFYDRINTDRRITKTQKYGSLFSEIIDEFQSLRGYRIEWRKLNAADFGVPQKRKRFILIGSRTVDPALVFAEIERSARYADPAAETGKRPWRTLREALAGLDDPEQEHVNFPHWGKYLRYVPPGGCWTSLPKGMVKKAMGGAADSDDPLKRGKQGGRTGFYRRLAWDAPAPTLVTSPVQLGSCICHPTKMRPLTVKEYARIQGFPDTWRFVGSTAQKYRMIGEAVPVDLAKAIAAAIKKHLV
ncbi:MAG: DNA cytosine methyltransferase [Nitrosopumilus sp.]|nr:DNA cytosine methyltransferase [Nitrosopumilus sp.]